MEERKTGFHFSPLRSVPLHIKSGIDWAKKGSLRANYSLSDGYGSVRKGNRRRAVLSFDKCQIRAWTSWAELARLGCVGQVNKGLRSAASPPRSNHP